MEFHKLSDFTLECFDFYYSNGGKIFEPTSVIPGLGLKKKLVKITNKFLFHKMKSFQTNFQSLQHFYIFYCLNMI